ncbi:uncharacterized protein LOC111908045 isoform X2 [Lactuca sativa]|uniref:uncharacterized protein LOC111908045 isoform X2 n=1 Tax=Lactuca sativa TaxID=4236 RepID=UPI000CD9285A|nr:uncharacterized protein LOC111908045 isoform X2 [Lactuca sativa]
MDIHQVPLPYRRCSSSCSEAVSSYWRVEVVARLKSLEVAAAPIVTFLQNPSAVQELRADKHYNRCSMIVLRSRSEENLKTRLSPDDLWWFLLTGGGSSVDNITIT